MLDGREPTRCFVGPIERALPLLFRGQRKPVKTRKQCTRVVRAHFFFVPENHRPIDPNLEEQRPYPRNHRPKQWLQSCVDSVSELLIEARVGGVGEAAHFQCPTVREFEAPGGTASLYTRGRERLDVPWTPAKRVEGARQLLRNETIHTRPLLFSCQFTSRTCALSEVGLALMLF